VAYWNASLISTPAFSGVYQELVGSDSSECRLRAFLELLASGDTAATSIALDCYGDWESMARHGIGNPLEPAEREVLRQARRLLREPASRMVLEPAALEEAANHASALRAIADLAEEQDGDLLAEALMSDSGSVRLEAAIAAASVFMDGAEGHEALIRALGRLLLLDDASYKERSAALNALNDADAEKAGGFVVRAVSLGDIRLQAQAMLMLADEDLSKYRPLIESRVADWPQAAPYPAAEVRSILRHGDME
jgi:HEAT repeat protein